MPIRTRSPWPWPRCRPPSLSAARVPVAAGAGRDVSGLAPKSNAATIGIAEARADVSSGRLLPVPVHLRDGHYQGAKHSGMARATNTPTTRRRDRAAARLSGGRARILSAGRGFERELAERLEKIRPAARRQAPPS